MQEQSPGMRIKENTIRYKLWGYCNRNYPKLRDLGLQFLNDASQAVPKLTHYSSAEKDAKGRMARFTKP